MNFEIENAAFAFFCINFEVKHATKMWGRGVIYEKLIIKGFKTEEVTTSVFITALWSDLEFTDL